MDDKYSQTDAKVEFDGVDLSAHLTTVSTVLDSERGFVEAYGMWVIYLEGPDGEDLSVLMPSGRTDHRVAVTLAGRRFEGEVLVKRRVEDHNSYTGDPWLWIELNGAPPTEVPPGAGHACCTEFARTGFAHTEACCIVW